MYVAKYVRYDKTETFGLICAWYASAKIYIVQLYEHDFDEHRLCRHKYTHMCMDMYVWGGI